MARRRPAHAIRCGRRAVRQSQLPGLVGARRSSDGATSRPARSTSRYGARWSSTSLTPTWRAKCGSKANSIRTCRHSPPSCNAAPAWLAGCRDAETARGAGHGRRGRKHEPRPDGPGAEFLGLAAAPVPGPQRLGSSAYFCGSFAPRTFGLFVPEVKNRVTGRSMGEHTEDMAKDWSIGRREQDELALEGHQRAIAAQDRGFFADLIVPLDGVGKDHFPRRDTSMES